MSDADGRPPALEMQEVSEYFDGGRVHALDGLSAAVAEGEAVAVTGPSGCGKSTMLSLLGGLDRPTSGRVYVAGCDLAQVHDLPGFRRRHIGMVFQLHLLLPQLTAEENVEVAMFGTGLGRRERRARAAELLETLDLGGRGHRVPAELSGGERQRVAVARAIANSPDVLLADEPTSSLDGRSARGLLELLAAMRRTNPRMAMLVATHDPQVTAFADRVLTLAAGRLVPEPAAGAVGGGRP